MSNYNDEHYNGIVLKIPIGVIITNPELEKAILVFRDTLNNCIFSRMHPSFDKNIYELAHYPDKANDFLDAKKEITKHKEREELKIARKLDRLDIPIVQKKYKCTTENDSLLINGIAYEWDEIMTKRGITSRVKKISNEFFASSTIEQFRSFCRDNAFYFPPDFYTPLFNHTRSYLYNDGYGIVMMSEIAKIELWQRGVQDRNKIYSVSVHLVYDSQLKLYYFDAYKDDILVAEKYESGNVKGMRTYLKRYNIKHGMFVKKDSINANGA